MITGILTRRNAILHQQPSKGFLMNQILVLLTTVALSLSAFASEQLVSSDGRAAYLGLINLFTKNAPASRMPLPVANEVYIFKCDAYEPNGKLTVFQKNIVRASPSVYTFSDLTLLFSDNDYVLSSSDEHYILDSLGLLKATDRDGVKVQYRLVDNRIIGLQIENVSTGYGLNKKSSNRITLAMHCLVGKK